MRSVIRMLRTLGVVFFGGAMFGSAHAGLNDGLVAYCPFNGNANDESGNGNHGTIYNATFVDEISGSGSQFSGHLNRISGFLKQPNGQAQGKRSCYPRISSEYPSSRSC
jgi:hypothetical protein